MTKMTPAARKARTAKITARTAFVTGVIVSLGANVIASQHSPLGIAIGLWIPIAFLLSLALLENVPAKGMAGKVRFAGILAIAAIAGWSSYWHLVDVASLGGADSLTAHALPITVDIMMAFAGTALKAKAATPARKRPAARKTTATNVRPIRKTA
jgi:hypothetical protein